MKNFIFLSAMLLCFTSCTNVLFVDPQPEGIGELTEIPENLQGVYAYTDSITVTSNTINGEVLGENLVVKKRGNFYYLNFLEDSVYSLTVVKVVKCLDYEDFEIFHPKISDDNKDIFNVVEVKSKTYGTVDSKEYIVDDVSVVQLNKMLSKDEDDVNFIRIK